MRPNHTPVTKNYRVIWSGARASSCTIAIEFLLLGFSHTFGARQAQSHDALVEDGYAQLQQGKAERFREALAHFDRALALDKAALRAFQAAESAFESKAGETPKTAVFFQGVALNEMGQTTMDYNLATVNPKLGAPKEFCAAILSIERSINLGMTPQDNPALYFELGLALVDANRFTEGIRQLDRFLRSKPIEPLKSLAETLRCFAEKQINTAKPSTKDSIWGKPIIDNSSPICGKPLVPKN